MATLSRFGVSLDQLLLRAFDRWLRQKGFANRSHALSELIREKLVAHQWEAGEGIVIGIVTLLYDPGHHVLSHSLVKTEHAHHDLIVTSQHIHMDAHNCLEVNVLKGSANEVKHLAEQLRSLKGIKHGEFIMTTSGAGLS